MSRSEVDPRFGDLLRALLEARGLSYRGLAARVYQGKSYVHDLATGRAAPTVDVAKRLDEALDAGGALIALVQAPLVGPPPGVEEPATDAELEAIELVRRVEASDIGDGTLSRLEEAADRMAMSYAGTPPEELLPRVRRHLSYVTGLVDVRATIEAQRRLLVVGGWLALLAATLHIDLRQRAAAEAWLTTAEQMAVHAGHDEIRAWCYETRAWDVLTDGRYPEALALSQRAQSIAPAGGSALIQATAQEGRAWARMGGSAETRDALERVARLVSNLRTPERPEHHYRYDPAKAISYTATTLAWVGDPAAEQFARSAIGELLTDPGGVPRPRRVASARLDLALALLAADKPDEAGAEALSAVTSGRIVPSNWWRATEVLAGVERSGVQEAQDLRDACHAFRPTRRELTS
ncbi:helix-turn-helix transcriptional regulator [Dactylosporangium roseum]|uniref:Helix-turn-helix transcriptional regulator n=2 Tax=Dactylosporangium roseum TaxID=47989 RepID=A0ABY5Z8Z0_9ACTN|nr:helix-turn-helix transcriptional regulator [Dactylosporangium roseum]UWZ38501.1 helix-turn-helix transcriptional regulator [Dactylosporangium roseum]